MSIVLDASALIAIERGDREMIALVKRERLAGRAPLTHGGVVGEVWRGGHGRQAALARLLPALEVRAIDLDLGRRAGVLLASAGGSDVLDAALIAIAVDGDEVLTSDVGDLRALARAAGKILDLIGV
ncbi:MAG TPA: PIN domain-containing protein [Candidatus Limnocylindria bacterium]|nr:PIN domain-containing protein [Candidatus Limnocylindria bacterium]